MSLLLGQGVQLPSIGFNPQDYIDALVTGYGPLYASIVGLFFAFLVVTLIIRRARTAVAAGK